MDNVDSELTREVKRNLNVFAKVGIASKERMRAAPQQYHPGKLLEDFQSVIVFAEGNKNDYDKHSYMGSFADYLGTLAAQSETVRYLGSQGYKAIIIPGSTKKVSLVQMAVQAGLGELSPVNSLVVEGYGLTTTLGAIITNAPLLADPLAANVCIKCMRCLDVCPARKEPYAAINPDECGCSKCRHECPV